MDATIVRADVRPGRGKLITVDGADVAVFQVGSRIFAVDNHCPHQHFSKLHEGTLDGTVITCPMHGHRFDLVTGGCVEGDGRLRKYEVVEDGDSVTIRNIP